MRAKKYSSAFTFVELLLVTAMLSVIGLAIYSTFNNGISLWLRISQQKTEEDIIIFFEKISYDLRNSFRYTGIDFEGYSDEMSFPVIAEFQTKKGRQTGIGRVNYIFDRTDNSIKLKASNYSEVYLDKARFQNQLVSNIGSLSFQYYSYDPDQKKYFWTNSWQTAAGEDFGIVTEKKIPLAARIEVEIKDGRFSRKFQRTVFIPAAYYLSFVEK